MSLQPYKQKRNFQKTLEPAPRRRESKRGKALQFVVQKHAASHLHYDFRLELDGVLKSWAVPKGPSLDPAVKSLAVQVEDHPLDYADFEGTIPPGEYGGGTVMVWDCGTWEPEGNARDSLAAGKLNFSLVGAKLAGAWSLVRMHGRDGDRSNWLLLKRRDPFAKRKADFNVQEQDRSEKTGRSLEEIAQGKPAGARSRRVKQSEEPQLNLRRNSGTGAGSSGSQKHSPAVDLSRLPGARKSPLPREFEPQLATLVRQAPPGDDWVHELKFDGYRILAWIQGGEVRLQTRKGKDWTRKFESVAAAVKNLSLGDSILDGEVVVLDDAGRSRFQLLQNSLEAGRNHALVYYIFDAPCLNGYDMRGTPLKERKAALRAVLRQAGAAEEGVIRFSDYVSGGGPQLVQEACRRGSEGIVSKLAVSPYESGRGKTWLKSKCQVRQEFVIGGYTQPAGARSDFGALLLGYYEGKELVYCGRVGTGFTATSLGTLGAKLRELQTANPPFARYPVGVSTRGVAWVRPQLVCEVELTEWTAEGMLRHPVFQGLREDKPASEIRRELPESVTDQDSRRQSAVAAHARPSRKKESPLPARRPTAVARRISAPRPLSGLRRGEPATVAGIVISHPDRVVFEETSLTKRDLALYCEEVAPWLLPHVQGRPLTCVRCPQGSRQGCFYQKHLGDSLPEGVGTVWIQEKSGLADYAVVEDLRGLISLVQRGVMEFHPWGARQDNVERPDRLVFDLDPDARVPWSRVVETALSIREVLRSAKLQSFVRTSGGKGLHVVCPLERRTRWEDLQAFAAGVAHTFVQLDPGQYTDNMRKAGRTGKIFIDYLRNQRGATSVASYSPRARAGAPVAFPVSWEELPTLTGATDFTLENVRNAIRARHRDPWSDFFVVRQFLSARVLQSLPR